MRPVAHFLARPKCKSFRKSWGGQGAWLGRIQTWPDQLALSVCWPFGVWHSKANAQSFFRFGSVGFYLPAAHKCTSFLSIVHLLTFPSTATPKRQKKKVKVWPGMHFPWSK